MIENCDCHADRSGPYPGDAMELIFSSGELREEVLDILGQRAMHTRNIANEIMRRNEFSFRIVPSLTDHECHSLAKRISIELCDLMERGLVVRERQGRVFVYKRKP